MTQTSALKSVPITNLDATPVIPNTTGLGAPGYVRSVYGYATPLAADAAGSTYQLCRIPSNAKVQAVIFESQAQGAGKISLSVYYSTSTVDGTTVNHQGLVVPTTGATFFASQIDCSGAVGPTNEINQSGNNPPSKRNKELWDALGLAADPGGFFDIVGVVDTTAITTGTGQIGLKVDFID
jgi:hypothetical protein